jgi:hypothetical protein
MLGFVLVFATLFLTYIAYKKNFVAIVDQIETKNKCSNFNLDVSGKIQNISIENGFIHVIWLDENGGFKVSIHDYCNGNLINELSIKDVNDYKALPHKQDEDVNGDDKNILS